MTEGLSEHDVNHALEILGLTLPVTSHDLDYARRVQLEKWYPARYANLTNHPSQYMQAYKKAEEQTRLIEAAYALLSVLLVPTDESGEEPRS